MFPDPKKIQSELAFRNQLKVEKDDTFYFALLNTVCSSPTASKVTLSLGVLFPASNPTLPLLQSCLAAAAPSLEINY